MEYSSKDHAHRNSDSDRAKDKNADDLLCCTGKVHIAYRGISDDRLYMAYGRKWSEVKFFRPHGLKVFCADCRRRIL